MIKKTAKKLHSLVAFWLFHEEDTEQTKAFINRMCNLFKKYGLEDNESAEVGSLVVLLEDDPAFYEEIIRNWDDSQIKALDGELDLINNRYEDLLNVENSNVDNENNENSNDEGVVDSDDGKSRSIKKKE